MIFEEVDLHGAIGQVHNLRHRILQERLDRYEGADQQVLVSWCKYARKSGKKYAGKKYAVERLNVPLHGRS